MMLLTLFSRATSGMYFFFSHVDLAALLRKTASVFLSRANVK